MEDYKEPDNPKNVKITPTEDDFIRNIECAAVQIREFYINEQFPEAAPILFEMANSIHNLTHDESSNHALISRIRKIFINTEFIPQICIQICNGNTGVLHDSAHLLYILSFHDILFQLFTDYDLLSKFGEFFLLFPRSKWLEVFIIIKSLIKHQDSITGLFEHLPEIEAKLAIYPGGLLLYAQLSLEIICKFPSPVSFENVIRGFCSIIDDMPFPETYYCFSKMIETDPNICPALIESGLFSRIVKELEITRISKSESFRLPLKLVIMMINELDIEIIENYEFIYSAVVVLFTSNIEDQIITAINFIDIIIPDYYQKLIGYISEESLIHLLASFVTVGSVKLKKSAVNLICKLASTTNDAVISLTVMNQVPKIFVSLLENNIYNELEIMKYFLLIIQYAKANPVIMDPIMAQFQDENALDVFMDIDTDDNPLLDQYVAQVSEFLE